MTSLHSYTSLRASCIKEGNVRKVLNGRGQTVQETHYYPYGMPFGESNAEALASTSGYAAQPYKYGGKEAVSMCDLSIYDFAARPYDPALAIFHTPDPMQEKNIAVHPFLYCSADPINRIDPSGMTDIVCPELSIDGNQYHKYIDDGVNSVVQLGQNDIESLNSINFDSSNPTYQEIVSNGVIRDDLMPTVNDILANKPFVGWETGANCFDLAEQQNTNKTDGKLTNTYVGDGESANFEAATLYIAGELTKGNSIVVGVNYVGVKKITNNNNPLTNHFVVVSSMGIEATSCGYVYYLGYYDNGTRDASIGRSEGNRFYQSGKGNGKIWLDSSNVVVQGPSMYIMSEVRRNIK